MARRVNTRFLAILTIVVVGGLMALLVLPRILVRTNVADIIAQAERAEQRGDWLRAVELYKRAVAADPMNMGLGVRLGDALHEAVRFDPELRYHDLRAWERVLEINPRYIPALRKLMDEYLAMVELAGRGDVFDQLRDRAERLAAADKEDPRAAAYAHIAPLMGWLNGLTVTQSDVERHLKALEEMAARNQPLPEIPYHVARVNIRRAEQLVTESQLTAADELFAKAMEIMDASAAARPDDALLQFRRYQIANSLIDSDPANAEKKYQPRAREAIALAHKLVKASDPNYIEIEMAVALSPFMYEKDEDRLAALRVVAAEKPEEPQVRLVLGWMLRQKSATRVEAIDLLSQPLPSGGNLVGSRVTLRSLLDFRRLTELVRARIDAWKETSDTAVRKELLERVEDSYKLACRLISEEDALMLDLKGRILLLKNEPRDLVEAIQKLQKAHSLLVQRRGADPELMLTLADAYVRAGQKGEARSLTADLVQRRPNLAPARKLLCQLLLIEGEQLEAVRHLDILEKQLGANDPDVVRFRLFLMDPKTRSEQMAAMIGTLPEDTDDQKLIKARAAMGTGQNAVAEKLLLQLREVDGQCVTATGLLTQMYVAMDRRTDAKAALEWALARKDDEYLRMLLRIVPDATVDQIAAARRGAVDVTTDPVEKEIYGYETARQANDEAEMQKRLAAVEKLAPDDLRVQSLQFRHFVERQDWDKAAAYADKLAKNPAELTEGLGYRFDLAMARGKFDEALSVANELTQKYEPFDRAWLALGRVQLALGQIESARGSFQKAVDRGGRSMDALRGLIDCNYRLGQPQAALGAMQEGMRAFPGNRVFIEMALRHEEAYGDPERVIAEREKILAASKESLQSWTSLASTYLRAAGNRQSRNDTAGATQFLAKASALVAQAQQHWPDEYSLYEVLVDVSLRQNKPDDALGWVRKLADRPSWSSRPESDLMMANLQWRLNRLEQAESAFVAAVEKSNGEFRFSAPLADFYLQTAGDNVAQLEKGVAMLKSIIAKSKSIPAYVKLLEIQLRMQKTDDAQRTLADALAAAPGHPLLLAEQGRFLILNQKTAEGLAKLDAALATDPSCQSALYYRGLGRLTDASARGDMRLMDAAAEDLRKLIELNPRNVDARISLARVYQRRSQPDEQIRELKAALEAVPNRVDIRVLLVQALIDGRDYSGAERIIVEAKSAAGMSTLPVWSRLHAELYLRRNKPEQALPLLQDVLKRTPDDAALGVQILSLLVRVKQGLPAMAQADKLIHSQGLGKDWNVRSLRAQALAICGRADVAAEEFDLAMGLAAKDADAEQVINRMVESFGAKNAEARLIKAGQADIRARIFLSLLYLGRNDTEKAAKIMDDVMVDSKLSAEYKPLALRTAGSVYLAARSYNPAYIEKSRDSYIRYLDLVGDQVPADRAQQASMIGVLNNLACLLADTIQPVRPQQAINYSQRAYDIMKSSGARDPYIMDTHGWILVLCEGNRMQEGIDLLNEVVELKSDLPDAAYHLGAAYLKRNLPDLAVLHLRRAAELLNARADRSRVDQEMLITVEDLLIKAEVARRSREPVANQ